MSSGIVAADQLRLFVERIERLECEKQGIADDIKDVYAELKSNGYCAKTVRKVVALRKLEADARLEADAMLATYREALGMANGFTPIEAAIERTQQQVRREFAEAEETTISVNGGPAVPIGVVSQALDVMKQRKDDPDALYAEAVTLVRDGNKASASWLQRQMRLGYNHAASLIERMEREGIVSSPDADGKREVLRFAPADAAA